jgi:hypothetical protein
MMNEVQARMDDYRTERQRWVEKVGSERLRTAARVGLLDQSDKVYREERRTVEYHGWLLEHEMPHGFEERDIVNPTLTMLEKLEEYNAIDPEVELVFIKWKEKLQGHSGKSAAVSKGRAALVVDFLGHDLYLWVG